MDEPQERLPVHVACVSWFQCSTRNLEFTDNTEIWNTSLRMTSESVTTVLMCLLVSSILISRYLCILSSFSTFMACSHHFHLLWHRYSSDRTPLLSYVLSATCSPVPYFEDGGSCIDPKSRIIELSTLQNDNSMSDNWLVKDQEGLWQVCCPRPWGSLVDDFLRYGYARERAYVIHFKKMQKLFHLLVTITRNLPLCSPHQRPPRCC